MCRKKTFIVLACLVFIAFALPSMGLDFSVEPLRLGELQVSCIAFSPDGTTLAAWHEEEEAVCLWDVRTQQQVDTFNLEWINTMAFSPDGTLLALGGTGASGNKIHLWDVAGQIQVGLMQSPTRSGVQSVAFSPDGSTLASSGTGGDKTVCLWDVLTQEQVGVLRGHIGQGIRGLAFGSDGRHLFSGGFRGDEPIRVWDVQTQQQVGELIGHLDMTLDLALSPDGKILASAGGAHDQAVYLWDVETQTRVGVLAGHSAHVGSVAFSPDGKLLASTVYWDDTVYIWDVEEQIQLGALKGHDATDFGWGDEVAISADGRWLACGSENGVELWELNLPVGAQAIRPSPAHEATDVSRDVVLTWAPGIYVPGVNGHRVYFSEDFNDVNDRIGGITQDASSHDPGRLDFETTYYWLVDEVNGPPDYTVYEGSLWHFTTEPMGYPMDGANITATASSTGGADLGPEKTIDGSGLDDNDLHSVEPAHMWLSDNEPLGAWIQYEFDKVHKLHEMWVWNSNQMIEAISGFGLKEVSVEHSTDGLEWTALADVPEFAQAPGTSGYAHNTTVGFGGAVAKYVRLSAISNWGGFLPQFGLSEVRFIYIPVSARKPSPASGSAHVAVDGTLSWRQGREAATHNVYLSTDQQAVTGGTVAAVSVPETSYNPDLDLGSTYFWRVDEVNGAETPTTWSGDIWSFSTEEYLVVEDFEDYDDDCDRIFFAWEDGLGHNGGTDIEDCDVLPSSGNGGGSVVGNASSPFTEQTIVHGGDQSMPLLYNNTGSAAYSEVTRTFAPGQDWTRHGVRTLSLWFCGAPDNAAAQMYVKLNDAKVTYDGDPGDLTRKGWQTWNMDLASFGVDLQHITKLSIGFDGHEATGTVLFDDIRLYRYSRQLVTPTEPDPASLAAHWQFEGNLQDSSGNGHHGSGRNTGRSGLAFVEGAVGQAVSLEGDHFVEIVGYQGVIGDGFETPAWSITAWVRTEAGGEVVSWGSSVSGNRMEFRIGPEGRIGAQGSGIGGTWSNTPINDGQWHHIAVTVQPNSTYSFGVELWLDGQIDTRPSGDPNPWHPKAGTTLKIGVRYDGTDRHFTGAIDDVRIYNRVLSHAELAWLAGKTKPFDKSF